MKITTLRTMAGTPDCPDGNICPSIHTLDLHPERRYVVTKKETDPAVAAAFAHLIGDDEQLGWTPSELFEGIE